MFLVPREGRIPPANRDPYHVSGANNIVREYKDDVLAMLKYMKIQQSRFATGNTFLAKSPLSRKIWVAAAMKTLGWIQEHESDNGACVLTFSNKGQKQLEEAVKQGLLEE